MNFSSTRNNDIKITSAQAIKQGLSEEGGLFVPESFPAVTLDEIAELSQKSYKERAFFVLSKYLTDFTEDELWNCINNAYTKEKFESDTIAPLKEYNDKEYFLELWHGPTSAFKDMALQILPHLLTVSIKKTGETKTVTILVATSGDTGKAALEGFKDVDGTKIMVFYPESGVSQVQQRQMNSQEGNNVCVSGVFGNFDDAQNGVKKIFTDEEYKKVLAENGVVLSSANSINFGRLVPQVVYYFSAYCDLIKNNKIKLGDKINVVVPTGNFGNILAAYYAKRMGLPVNKLICASNSNNVLTDFIKTGVYDKTRDFYLTISPSMDILISSNLERFLYEISGKDAEKTAKYMSELSANGKYEISDDLKAIIADNFYGGFCDDNATKETIKKVFEEKNYLIDTHTAVAKKVYDQYKEETGDETVSVIASTANPYKFVASVLSSVKEDYNKASDEFSLIDELEAVTGAKIPAPLANLKNKAVRFTDSCKKEDMQKAVSEFLKVK